MQSDDFEVEGRIALVDLPDYRAGDPEAHERRREGRLNDVLIVLERDAPSVEQAILARLRGMDLAGPSTAVSLTFDEREPRFAVAVRPGAGDPANRDALVKRGGAIAEEVEQEILGAIARRTNAANHFSPEVDVHPKGAWPRTASAPSTAAGSAPAPPALATRSARRRPVRTTVWLQILFFLLAAVVFATAYLYLNQPV